jgi:hypothetical protein
MFLEKLKLTIEELSSVRGGWDPPPYPRDPPPPPPTDDEEN